MQIYYFFSKLTLSYPAQLSNHEALSLELWAKQWCHRCIVFECTLCYGCCNISLHNWHFSKLVVICQTMESKRMIVSGDCRGWDGDIIFLEMGKKRKVVVQWNVVDVYQLMVSKLKCISLNNILISMWVIHFFHFFSFNKFFILHWWNNHNLRKWTLIACKLVKYGNSENRLECST